jgi:hypothetical protein
MSCNTESWAKGSLEDAVMMLAKRAAVARLLREKKADMGETFSTGLSALQRQIELNPALAATVGGAALGAGAGGLSSFAADPERRHTGRSMLTGALAGGAVGGGGYLASRMIPQLEQTLGPKGDAVRFPGPGGPREVDPAAIRQNPQVIAEIEKLRSKSWPTQAATGTWDFLKNYAGNHPILATMLGLDVAGNTASTAAGWASGLPGTRPNVLREGMTRATSTEGEAGKDINKMVRKWLHTAGDGQLDDLLIKAREAGSKGHLQIPGLDDMGTTPVSRINEWYNKGTPGGSGLRSGNFMQSMRDIADSFSNVDPTAEAGDPASRVKWLGLEHSPGASTMSKLRRRMATLPGSTSWAGKLGPRAALYLGVPAAQAYAGTLMQENENQKRLEQLIQQLSVPAKSAPGA